VERRPNRFPASSFPIFLFFEVPVMSFDALTIAGILAALLAGGFFLGLFRHNDTGPPRGGGNATAGKDRA
jgi:hypothetical protein